MREFRSHGSVDDASRELLDPLVMSHILLRQKIVIANKKEKFTSCVKNIKNKAVEHSRKNNTLYVIIKDVNGKWVIRTLLIGGVVAAILYEDSAKNVTLHGSEAFELVTTELYRVNPMVKYTIGVIPVKDLPDSLKKYVVNLLEALEGNVPPKIWFSKYLYDIFVETMISDKGGYMYVLLGRDRLNNRYAIKIPREKTIDGKPLAISTNPNTIAEVFKGVMNSLEVSLMTREDIKKGLSSLGYEESLVDTLVVYKKYILKPRAIILLRDIYSSDDYMETPPVIIEDYADLGDLTRRIRERNIDERELAFIALRVSGALALIHTARIVHMDIKPHNILLTSDDSEPYGYAPLLGDFVGSPHVFDESIEIKKSTPEYADPLSLIKGKAGFSFDIYSLGTTLYNTITGKKLRGRVLANLVALKELYGVTVPIKAYLVDNPDLTPYLDTFIKVYREFKTKKTTYQELVEVVVELVDKIDEDALKTLNKKLSKPLANIIKKTVSLDETVRYKDAVALWLDFLEAVKKLGYTNLIPIKMV